MLLLLALVWVVWVAEYMFQYMSQLRLLPCVDGQRSACFQFWAVGNKAAVSVCVDVLVWMCIFTSLV